MLSIEPAISTWPISVLTKLRIWVLRAVRAFRSFAYSEVKDSNWRVQSWKRVFFNKVPHYKTNAELAAEYEQRTGKKL